VSRVDASLVSDGNKRSSTKNSFVQPKIDIVTVAQLPHNIMLKLIPLRLSTKENYKVENFLLP